MNRKIFENRREQARQIMCNRKLGALLISLPANRYYLSGFELHDPQINESSGYLLLMANGRDILFTDSRYYDAALRLWPKEDLHIYRGLALASEEINQVLRGRVWAGAHVGFEAKIMPLAFFEKFSAGLPVQAADGLVEDLRIIKDSSEIEIMRQSAHLNHQLMRKMPDFLLPGRTEAEVAWDIEQFFRNHGATENAFSPIVAIGPNAALPHAIPGETLITENCPVLIDVGARLNDYNSDQTRTFWVGDQPSPEFTLTMDQLREAQTRAIAGIRPGVPCAEVYALARDYLDSQNVGQFFTHGLGHGVGLQTHEAPSLGARSKHILKPGMIVTVEPGLYYPKWGGIRWEYMILVTEDGHKVL